MSNPLLDIMREGNSRKWCMTPYCTTCGSLEYRSMLKELAGPFGGPLANALQDIDINELTSVPNWQDGLLIAIIDLPISMQVDGILKTWLPKAVANIRFADYVLFKIVRCLSRESNTRREWIKLCLEMAVETKDFSLIESLVLVLGQDAKNFPELITISTDHARISGQMKRVLLNACNLNVEMPNKA